MEYILLIIMLFNLLTIASVFLVVYNWNTDTIKEMIIELNEEHSEELMQEFISNANFHAFSFVIMLTVLLYYEVI